MNDTILILPSWLKMKDFKNSFVGEALGGDSEHLPIVKSIA